MRRILFIAMVGLAVVIAVLVGRALTMRSRQVAVEPVDLVSVDTDAAVGRFSASLRFPTVSVEEKGEWNAEAFRAFLAYIVEKYPRVHAALRMELVNEYTPLYTWEGRDPQRKPILLLSHYDVVPVIPGTENQWEHPAFGGDVAGGFIWGRGALDDKFGVMAILEAVDLLLAQGFQPASTIYLSFGHDEEIGGPEGAQRVAALLESRGVELDFLLDEGGAIVRGTVPGVDGLVAAVGIAEKGSVTVEVIARAAGGHSSSPPPHTAIGILATALHKLEREQMPKDLRGAALRSFEYAGPEMPLLYRVAFGNLWLFRPLIESQLERLSPATNAMVRTTTAVTVVEGGVKSNVLPTDARALVNFRILPGDTADEVVAHVKRVVGDESLEVRAMPDSREPSEVSPVDTAGFTQIQRTIRQVFPGTLVVPYLTVGGTDSRYFIELTPNIYKFAPIVAEPSDLPRMHGLNERVSVDNYVKAVQFFAQMIRNVQEGSGPGA